MTADFSTFIPLQTVLTKVVRKYNLERQVNASMICHEFRKIAKTLWGNDVEQKIQTSSFKNGTLQIHATHSGWAQKVQLKKHTILEALNQKYPTLPIKHLKIYINPTQSERGPDTP